MDESSSKQNLGTVIDVLVRLLELHCPTLGAHSRRVSMASEFVAIQMNMIMDEVDDIRVAGQLHDIGKISVPPQILLKDTTKLNVIEKTLIGDHAFIGDDILKPILELEGPRKLIRHHHENFNGTGWPDKLSGDAIPMGSRIIAVTNVYDKILHLPTVSSASARKEFAMTHLNNNSGTLYDRSIVDTFTEFVDFKDVFGSEIKEMPVEVTKLDLGMVLSQDLRGPNNLLVLPRDTRIGEKELRKVSSLTNISSMQKPAYIYIE